MANRTLDTILSLFRSVEPVKLQKAIEDLQDDVDIRPQYESDFRAALNRVPTGEVGKPVGMSGSAENLQSLQHQISALATNQSQMVQSYGEMAEALKSMESAFLAYVGATAPQLGLRDLARDVEAYAAKANQKEWPTGGEKKAESESESKDEEAEDEMSASEKGKIQTKSLASVFARIGNTREPLRSPPNYALQKAAIAKAVALHDDSEFESRCAAAGFDTTRITEARAIKQRLQFAARNGIGMQEVLRNSDPSVVTAVFPELRA